MHFFCRTAVLCAAGVLALIAAGCGQSKGPPGMYRAAPPPAWGGTTPGVPWTPPVQTLSVTNFVLPDGTPGWELKLHDKLPVPTPAAEGSRLYVGGGFGSYYFYCVDAATGAEIWTSPTASDGPSAPVISGDYVAYTTESCTLEVLNKNSGALAWARWLGDPVTAHPSIAGSRVLCVYPNMSYTYGSSWPATPGLTGPVAPGSVTYGAPWVGNESHVLACFDVADGSFQWGHEVPCDAIAAPIIHNNVVYCATLDGTVTQVELLSGTLLSQAQLNATSAPWVRNSAAGATLLFARREADVGGSYAPSQPATPPADLRELMRTGQQGSSTVGSNPMLVSHGAHLHNTISDASQYFRAGSQALLDTDYDVAAWVASASQPQRAEQNVGVTSVFGMWCYQGSRPVVDVNRVYAAVGNRVIAADLSGNEIWSFTYKPGTQWRLLNPPAVAGGRLVLSGLDGVVMVVDCATGVAVKQWQFNAVFTHQPAVHQGMIYVGASNGRLIAINTGDGTLTGWSQWGGGPGHNGS